MAQWRCDRPGPGPAGGGPEATEPPVWLGCHVHQHVPVVRLAGHQPDPHPVGYPAGLGAGIFLTSEDLRGPPPSAARSAADSA